MLEDRLASASQANCDQEKERTYTARCDVSNAVRIASIAAARIVLPRTFRFFDAIAITENSSQGHMQNDWYPELESS